MTSVSFVSDTHGATTSTRPTWKRLQSFTPFRRTVRAPARYSPNQPYCASHQCLSYSYATDSKTQNVSTNERCYMLQPAATAP